MLDYDKLFYEFCKDEGSEFALRLLQDIFRFNSKFPKIDEEEIRGAFGKVREYIRSNTSPLTPQILELGEEAKLFKKVRLAYTYAYEN